MIVARSIAGAGAAAGPAPTSLAGCCFLSNQVSGRRHELRHPTPWTYPAVKSSSARYPSGKGRVQVPGTFLAHMESKIALLQGCFVAQNSLGKCLAPRRCLCPQIGTHPLGGLKLSSRLVHAIISLCCPNPVSRTISNLYFPISDLPSPFSILHSPFFHCSSV